MITLQRELRLKFEEILKQEAVFCSDGLENESPYKEIISDLAYRLADSALELRGFQDKPAFDMSKAGIEWSVLAGAEINQHDIDETVLLRDTIDAFESAFSIKGNWNWYPAKPSEMRVWEDFRARLVQIYQADKDAFTKYVTWAAQPYSRGAMTGLHIKKNPQDFPDAWASFCMGTGYKPPRQVVPDSERTDLDDDGIPQSYM